eukprot:7143826-Ditylum_brightwellii.AAC.1
MLPCLPPLPSSLQPRMPPPCFSFLSPGTRQEVEGWLLSPVLLGVTLHYFRSPHFLPPRSVAPETLVVRVPPPMLPRHLAAVLLRAGGRMGGGGALCVFLRKVVRPPRA